jgi:glycosyltransferase involved in cell wall biosynthesis
MVDASSRSVELETAKRPDRGECFLSVVIPVYNEQDNVEPLHERLSAALGPAGREYEIVYVDDGSSDLSLQRLTRLADKDPATTVIQLRRNFGQTAAMTAGIDQARGTVIVVMDADLQNDPADIPRLLTKLEEGYDMVSGWRQNRQDNWFWRKVPSFFANRLISRITGVTLQDYGCTLKAYRRELFDHVRLYGEMHRFIPAFVGVVGGSVAEIPVQHHPRTRGTSKYGIGRTYKVLLDLVTVKFLGTFSGSPIYLFGGVGLGLACLAFLTGVAMVLQKIWYGTSFIQTPLLLLATLFLILGFHSILMGLTAELLVRIYHESQGRPIYVIRRVFGSRR